jgi:hypothetical protein
MLVEAYKYLLPGRNATSACVNVDQSHRMSTLSRNANECEALRIANDANYIDVDGPRRM